jgi:heme exporter protein C
MMQWLHRMASPAWFYRFSSQLIPWFVMAFLTLFLIGLYGGLVIAPADYQQGDAFRIIYIHVPAAWMSLFIYIVMAVYAVITLIWRIKLAEILLISSVPVGIGFTVLALATGSLWGKPMWGTWWSWDARLTSELLLLFLYLGAIGLYRAIEDKRDASRVVSILVLVGTVNIPIIHYSVEWWNTLHQGSTITFTEKPSMHMDMLIPLMIMAVAFKFFYGISLLLQAKAELVEREFNSKWLKGFLEEGGNE